MSLLCTFFWFFYNPLAGITKLSYDNDKQNFETYQNNFSQINEQNFTN